MGNQRFGGLIGAGVGVRATDGIRAGAGGGVRTGGAVRGGARSGTRIRVHVVGEARNHGLNDRIGNGRLGARFQLRIGTRQVRVRHRRWGLIDRVAVRSGIRRDGHLDGSWRLRQCCQLIGGLRTNRVTA